MINRDFLLGFNYWASNAGMKMWRNFDIDRIDADFKLMSEYGVNTIRIFPLWPDFQPIALLREYRNIPYDIRYTDDTPLPPTAEGRAGVDPIMIERMRQVLLLAEKYNFGVILSLLTGWMSGRMFVPEPFSDRNLIEDPFAVRWEIRFVKYMTKTFRDCKAIIAWELGNECNCLSRPSSDDAFFVWTQTIASAIRECDKTRPVMSGMPLATPYKDECTIRDIGEITDILVTHPYNFYSQNTILDEPVSVRSLVHSAMLTSMARDIGEKPAFIQEINSFGAGYCTDEDSVKFLNMHLGETLGQGYGGLLWWCAFDQDEFSFPPYDWCGHERDLGLFTFSGNAKPAAKMMLKFSKLIQDERLAGLSSPEAEAACLMSKGARDTWDIALGVFALSRQADLNIQFWTEDQEIPNVPIYILPCCCREKYIQRHHYLEILRRVKEGAVLYFSLGERFIEYPFCEAAGVKVEGLFLRQSKVEINLDGEILSVCSNSEIRLTANGARVVAKDQSGNPVMFENSYGKGRVITLAVPVEEYISVTPDAMSSQTAANYHNIYLHILRTAKILKTVQKNNRYIFKSIRRVKEGELLVCVNPTLCAQTDLLTINSELQPELIRGDVKITEGNIELKLEPGGFAVILLRNS